MAMTVEQWLGEDNQLGLDIWHKKYQRDDENFEQWLDRVSGGDEKVKELIRDKKFLFGGRILSNRGVKGKRISYSNCFSGETKIITKDGLKTLEELKDKDIKVLSEGGWRKATVKSFGHQPVKRLVLQKGKATKDFYVTGEHIWYAKQRNSDTFQEVTTNNLIPGMLLRRDLNRGYRSYKPSPFGVAHGFFWGDGDHKGDNRRANFCGEKQELLKYFMPDTYSESNNVLAICGIPKIFWNYPSLNETSSYLYGWLAGYFAADGSVGQDGTCVLCSTNINDLLFVQDVLCVLGIPSEGIRSQTRLSNLTNQYGTVYILSLNKYYLNENFFVLSKHKQRFLNSPPAYTPLLWKVKEVSDVIDVREVFCAVVPETHNFCIEGNILTHNCYVITPPEDNIESIYDSRKKLARTYSTGGGCGIDLSKLSPRGAKINNAAKETTGAVSFMEGYSKITEEIGAAGRRGALMISLDCTHPDLEEFINCKTSPDAVTKANISVRVSDEFMDAVKRGANWKLSFTRPETGETIEKIVNAKEIFDTLCQNNADWAEPGILFWDAIKNWNLLSENPDFEYGGVNPCAEEPLPPGGSCLLGAINLAQFVHDKKFCFDDFVETVRIAVKALNDVLDEGLPLHPLVEQRNSVRDWRQIGLGIMGLADMFIKMEIPYDSREAALLSNEIGFVMINNAIQASAKLASLKEYGPYPKFNQKFLDANLFFDVNTDSVTNNMVRQYGLCNSQLLTIAPTGSISTMIGVSGGIEPIFANSYTRKTESLNGKDTYYKVYTPIVKEYMEAHGIEKEEDLPKWFVTAQNIDPFKRIDIQSIWQRHIDASISSTVNLPHNTSVETIKKLYLYAWENHLKGLTIFRDGCKRTGVLTTKPNDAKIDSAQQGINPLHRGDIIDCSNDLIGKKRKLRTGCGSLHVLAYFDPVNGDMMEVYLSKGSQGGCGNFMTGLSRTISLLCRAGVSVEAIKDQLDSTGTCSSYAVRSATKHDTSKGSCCPMAVGNALMEMWREMQDDISDDSEEATITQAETVATGIASLPSETKVTQQTSQVLCPECGEPLTMTNGCQQCSSCGYSKCD